MTDPVASISAPSVEEGVEDLDVVAASRPVQRCLAVRAGEAGVDVGSGGDEHCDGLGPVGVKAGPVGDDVEQCSGHTTGVVVTDGGGRQLGVLVEKAAQGDEVAAPDRSDDLDGEGVVARDGVSSSEHPSARCDRRRRPHRSS